MEHTLETLAYCPSCSNPQYHPFLNCQDFTSSQAVFHIVECSSCGLRFTNPRPTEEHIGPYYDNPNYVSHTDTSKGLLFRTYQAVKEYTLNKKAEFLRGLTSGNKVLDYGAGTGDFAQTMSKAGWKSFAFEPNPAARARIMEKHRDVKLIRSLTDVPDASLDVITLWHVLEHVHGLNMVVEHFHRALEKEGTLVIAVPNCSSYDARYYKEYWAAYDVPRHIYHFQPETLPTLLAQYGFVLGTMKPMWFDSFYVSLLSESYKNRNANTITRALGPLRALCIGTISNLYALSDTRKCSSVVYTFKKA